MHTLVDVLAQLGDLRLADPVKPIACTRSSTRRVETPPIQASSDYRDQLPSLELNYRASRNGGKSSPGTQLRNAQLQDLEPR